MATWHDDKILELANRAKRGQLDVRKTLRDAALGVFRMHLAMQQNGIRRRALSSGGACNDK